MVIDEIFPNPTVKQVIFELKFSNLFYIEDKIGDLQLKVMERFPDANLIFRRQILFADKGPEGEIEIIPPEISKGVK